MKRSEMDFAIDRARALLERFRFSLPPFGCRSREDWEKNAYENEEAVRELMLGWDVTDFGSGEFLRTGATLFTLRNGAPAAELGTPYAEKLLFFSPGQYIPFHYHAAKTEDIINRGGGILRVTLFNAKRGESYPHGSGVIDRSGEVCFYTDGRKNTLPAGSAVDIPPGSSITLRPFMYHRLGAAETAGELLAGEVSSVNDDRTDNFFLEPLPRFSKAEEDAPARYLLVNEYGDL